MNKKAIGIGQSDFKNLIDGDCYYVDKTLFIKEIIDSRSSILLLPRPRRFGKHVTYLLLDTFLEKLTKIIVICLKLKYY